MFKFIAKLNLKLKFKKIKVSFCFKFYKSFSLLPKTKAAS